MKDNKNNERRFSSCYGNNFAQAQTNVQQPFSNIACHCELAAKQPTFETSQSCVCTTAPLSHRFKSSPSISGKVAVPGTAGYMMNAGHFSENLESSGDLNRSLESRGSQTSGVLLVLFVQAKRINSFSLQRTSRFCEPRFSSPQWRLPTNKIKTFPKGASRFCKPRISAYKQPIRTNKIKSFCSSAAYFSAAVPPLKLSFGKFVPAGTARSACISRRPCRLFCCCRNISAASLLFYTFRILSDFLSPFKLCLWLFSKKHRIILFSK